jgi:hypothetical protein
MPDLLKEVLPSVRSRGPVVLVNQDPVKTHAFERMLNNSGINTVVAPPVNEDQLKHLGGALSPSPKFHGRAKDILLIF